MTYDQSAEQDLNESGKFIEDELSTEDIEREAVSRLLIEQGEPIPVKDIKVVIFRTELHHEEIGIRKTAQWESKSRQFSPDMRVTGRVTYLFDEDRLLDIKTLPFYEKQIADSMQMSVEDMKKDPKAYKLNVLKPFKKLPKSKKESMLSANNEKLPQVPPHEDCELVVAVDRRFWDAKIKDKTETENVEVNKEGEEKEEATKENYLVHKFGEYATINRALVIKIFRELNYSDQSKKGEWLGTIEQTLLNSTMLTHGETDELLYTNIFLPSFDYVVPLIQAHTLHGQRYVMPVVSRNISMEELFEASVIKGVDADIKSVEQTPMAYQVRFFLIEKRAFRIAKAFWVIDPSESKGSIFKGRKVARIDGHVIRIGHQCDIKIMDDVLARDPLFRSNLVLFGAMVNYLPEMQQIMRKLYNELRTKVSDLDEDDLRAAVTKYVEDLEKDMTKKGKISPGTTAERIDFALKLITSDPRFDKLNLNALLRRKYSMILTPYELSMFFNPRRVRS
jgi:hypothetical protein